MRYHLPLVRMAITKKSITISDEESMEKREHFFIVIRNVNWYSHM